MAIRLLSDLHLEFGGLELPIYEDQKDDILVLAGDIGIAKHPGTYRPFIEAVAPHFRAVIYIMGNHEHYKGSLKTSLVKIKNDLREFKNVHVVNNLVVRIDDISFVCSTMWSSYDRGSPIAFYDANLWMNDHKKIRTGPSVDAGYMKKFKAEDAYEEYLTAINFIFPAIKEEKAAGQKVVVVTHHAPSYQSVAEAYRTGEWSKLNGAYASNLEEDILDAQPDLWVHGHTHTSFAYEIGETAVFCNPRGYKEVEENPLFYPELRIALK